MNFIRHTHRYPIRHRATDGRNAIGTPLFNERRAIERWENEGGEIPGKARDHTFPTKRSARAPTNK
jgi:hypothetical protein